MSDPTASGYAPLIRLHTRMRSAITWEVFSLLKVHSASTWKVTVFTQVPHKPDLQIQYKTTASSIDRITFSKEISLMTTGVGEASNEVMIRTLIDAQISWHAHLARDSRAGRPGHSFTLT
jgi:hypothetical protein